MAAPYATQGLLSRAFRWIRIHADEPGAVNPKYSNDDLAVLLSQSLDQITNSVYNMAVAPPISRVNIETVAEQQLYTLPPNIKEIRRMMKLSSTTGLVEWEWIPGHRLRLGGPGVILEGTRSIRLMPIPQQGGDTVTIEYVPGGPLLMHQNAAPLYDANNDTGNVLLDSSSFHLYEAETTWRLGSFDRRENAYHGQSIRLLGTVNDVAPSGLPFFPIQERRINVYDAYDNLRVDFDTDLDSGFVVADISDEVDLDQITDESRTYILYEVLPDIDPSILWLATIECAIQICTIEKRREKVALLQGQYQKALRAAQTRWHVHQTRVPAHMEDNPTGEIFDGEY